MVQEYSKLKDIQLYLNMSTPLEGTFELILAKNFQNQQNIPILQASLDLPSSHCIQWKTAVFKKYTWDFTWEYSGVFHNKIIYFWLKNSLWGKFYYTETRIICYFWSILQTISLIHMNWKKKNLNKERRKIFTKNFS